MCHLDVINVSSRPERPQCFFHPRLLRVGGRGVEGPAVYRPDVTLDR
jgi:hypothetical protein